MASKTDSLGNTLKVVLGVSLVCSIIVSIAAVGLRDVQKRNVVEDVQRSILSVSGVALEGKAVSQLYSEVIEPRLVDLETGHLLPQNADVASYNQRAAAKDPSLSIALDPSVDVAGILRRANKANVYLVRGENNAVERIILPIHGRGLWSTMYAFLAIQPDGKTVDAIVYYEQGETPGLGGEVANPLWQAKFVGKKLFNAQGQTAITVVKGSADPASPHQIDGLSGSTLTNNGINNTFQFWLGENGFGKFLSQVQQGVLNNG